MNIGILAVDSNYPNLALMKISSYHKARGDNVEWYNPLCSYDKVYIAKVFSFTPDYGYYINADQVEKGGTGYDIKKVLLPEIDRMIPDYDLYNVDKNLAYGFLTRGCPNHCKWCVVPKKEGNIATYMDIEEIAVNGRKTLYSWITTYLHPTTVCSRLKDYLHGSTCRLQSRFRRPAGNG